MKKPPLNNAAPNAATLKNPMKVTNVIVAGLGGQGVLKASDILCDALFRTGCDIKKSEVHGMSQRGGSVSSDIRFGAEVFSPMVPPGEADCLVVIAPDQVEVNRPNLRPGGVLITPDMVDQTKLSNRKSLNVALLGVLSKHLPNISMEQWREAIKANFPEKLHAANFQAFETGQAAS
jgi:indolepyruvate ferredoxin oxidoreductase, beta subunit